MTDTSIKARAKAPASLRDRVTDPLAGFRSEALNVPEWDGASVIVRAPSPSDHLFHIRAIWAAAGVTPGEADDSVRAKLDAPGVDYTRASASLLVRTLRADRSRPAPRLRRRRRGRRGRGFRPGAPDAGGQGDRAGQPRGGADAHAKAFQETPDLRFLMILALRLGRTLGELMDAIDTHELSLWREFNRQSPLGDERADLLAASLAAVVAQAAGAKVRVTDMLVRWDADDAQPSAEAGADA